MSNHITHEPDEPVVWPFVNVNVQLTDDSVKERIAVNIHGDTHYLHTSTAIELLQLLDEKLKEWAEKELQASGFALEKTIRSCKRNGEGSRGLYRNPPIP